MSSVTDVLAPANGEGTRATVLRWCKAVGDRVVKDEPLLELETDKVTVEIASPADGCLIEVLKEVNAEVNPDEVLARLSSTVELATEPLASGAKAPGMLAQPKVAAGSPGSETRTPLSPSVRRLLHENALTASEIDGTGRNGRITAQDVTRHVNEGGAARDVALEASSAANGARVATAGGEAASLTGSLSAGLRSTASVTSLPSLPSLAPAAESRPGSLRFPHTAIRRRVAEHMARSLVEAPHVTTLFEADLTRVLAHRALHAAAYESRGARLTLTAYFIVACVRALRAHPEVNATFHSDAMEVHGDVNIGVGTALGNKGLIVPVLHRAQGFNLFGVAQRLGQMVEAARGGKLAPADVRGGTFTLSNHGVGGSLLAAPIVINQPQVAILGVGKVQRRVCAVEVGGVEAISVRSMCYVTLTIDHRALDAFQANSFLSMVVATLENWAQDDS